MPKYGEVPNDGHVYCKQILKYLLTTGALENTLMLEEARQAITEAEIISINHGGVSELPIRRR